MTKALRITISAVALALVLLALVPLSIMGGRERSELVCGKVEVCIHDNGLPDFVRKEDVLSAIGKNYGSCEGKRLETLDLARMEEIVGNLSAVARSEAYVTNDGLLNIEIWQREPAIMFKTAGGGYYADSKGFIFPLVSGYDAPITTITGDNPLRIAEGYRGEPKTKKEREWLNGVLEFKDFIGSKGTWKGAFSGIRSNADGDLILTPVTGKEKFIFGSPDNMDVIKDKFRRIEDYYKYIAPLQENDGYRSVNVKYDGQIICRRK